MINIDSFLPQIVELDKSINLFCLVFLTLEFSFTVFFLFIYFLFFCTADTIRLHCFIPNQAALLIIGQYFLPVYFKVFDIILLSDLNFHPNNLLEILFITVFSVDCLVCLNISLRAIKISKSSFSALILLN